MPSVSTVEDKTVAIDLASLKQTKAIGQVSNQDGVQHTCCSNGRRKKKKIAPGEGSRQELHRHTKVPEFHTGKSDVK